MKQQAFLAEVKNLSKQNKDFKFNANKKWVKEKIREVAGKGDTSLDVRWCGYGTRFPFDLWEDNTTGREKMHTYLLAEGLDIERSSSELKISWGGE